MPENTSAAGALPEMRLELIPVPVSDVDRARSFYEQAGFALLVDVQPVPGMRVVQLMRDESPVSGMRLWFRRTW